MTALVSWAAASSQTFVSAIAGNGLWFWGLVIAQLGIVMILSARVDRLSSAAAAILFVCYSALTGLTLSFLLLAYTGESVASAFIIAAGMFGALAAFGTMTRRDLSGLGTFLFLGLVGVVLASIAGVFWKSSALQLVISFIGVAIFAGLAAYDAQRLRNMAEAGSANPGAAAISGALSLYLDFLNLFVFLLRLVGRQRR